MTDPNATLWKLWRRLQLGEVLTRDEWRDFRDAAREVRQVHETLGNREMAAKIKRMEKRAWKIRNDQRAGKSASRAREQDVWEQVFK